MGWMTDVEILWFFNEQPINHCISTGHWFIYCSYLQSFWFLSNGHFFLQQGWDRDSAKLHLSYGRYKMNRRTVLIGFQDSVIVYYSTGSKGLSRNPSEFKVVAYQGLTLYAFIGNYQHLELGNGNQSNFSKLGIILLKWILPDCM